MAKAELKTNKTGASVDDFISSIEDDQQREESKTILKLMKKVTGDSPKMWGSSIIGFIDTHLKYSTGRELEWFKVGFSPRKKTFSFYLSFDVENEFKDLLPKLGKYSTGKGCLYVKKLGDIDLDVLEKIMSRAAE